MSFERRAVLPLRICLVVLFGVLVVFETLSLPGQWAHMAKESPDDAHLRWPLTVVTIFWVVCVQVVVVCTWKLLGMVQADRIFTPSSMRWVDGIVAAIAAAWTTFLAVFLWVGFNADDPGAPLLMFLLLVCGAVLGLLMVVLRALLRQATTLRTDMEAVI
ncbi:DUF2975 domain-containing protein [Nocardioides sp. YIM 152315]|uniref:DUF2975 domain-containing protein n=1 Tax=Nocardioides sp. YIM 152315 TaxID=3031760 RepID=UPI0023DA0D93|nr:DUF2975 domain-containing protein [Nocardioides sp. YIM 152315]MDF1603932.1 DUF2975 domain-containing protein [Nocardioides sp. YIM 152315]